MTVSSAGAIKELVGLRTVFGVHGTTLTNEMREQFKQSGARGIILYRRNYENPQQVRKLLGDLEEAVGKRLLVCVDHEGGRVIMFRDGFTVFPDNLSFGTVGKDAYVRREGEIEAAELRYVGVDVNFAPVLDIMAERYGPSLNRSYAKDPDRVSRLGSVRIKALQSGGISATAKHFPGKGHATQDAHFKLPYIDSTMREMKAWHLEPFAAAIDAGVDCIMTSHPCYRKIDPDIPATFSRKIAHDLLRGELGFKGVVVTDDLEMGAVKDVAPIDEAIVRAAKSGHDLFLVCHTYAAEAKAIGALQRAYEDGSLDKKELEAGAMRVEQLMAKRPQRFGPEPKTKEEGEKLARTVGRECVRVLSEGTLPLPLPHDIRKDLTFTVVFPRFSEIAPKIVIEQPLQKEEAFVKDEWAKRELKTEVLLAGIEPTEDDLRRIESAVTDKHTAVVFCYDAHFYPGWKRILESVQARARNTIVVPLRDPYDQEYVTQRSSSLTAFGFRLCQLEAVFERLFG